MNDVFDEDRHQIAATSSLALSGARVLKHGDTFAVFDQYGDIRPHGTLGAQGLYHEGTRHLSSLRVLLGGARMLLLSSNVRDDNVLFAVDGMSPDLHRGGELVVPHGTLHLLRSKFLFEGTCYEHMAVTNFGPDLVEVTLAVEVAADFADVFEVRGTRRERRGVCHEAELHGNTAVLSYTGLDGEQRSTHVLFSPAPGRFEGQRALFPLTLSSRQMLSVELVVTCARASAATPARSFSAAYAQVSAELERHEHEEALIQTSNEQFNEWVRRSVADLRMMITETPYGPYPYAGVPWFSAPFGRDALITAFEALWVDPDLARGVLSFLAATQASERDDARDAEPGKILHEMRSGEMAALSEIPFGRYYGSVDATPLFVMLAAAYHERTGDHATIERLWPHVERALAWIDQYGDADGDGFVEYGARPGHGLANQGWKDSHDSVFHADGTFAKPPIALAEVQAYVYGARRAGAALASRLGHAEQARALDSAADALRERFDKAFWCDELGMYALALDGAKRPCRVRSSNAGHALFTGIALPERAPVLAEQLLARTMFSGWGVRTLADAETRYNPMSYHNGSVWPHDNALLGAGLGRYGLRDHATRILSGLFDAGLFVELHRLPELLCGFARRPDEGPTLYPVACAPQSWAAAAPLLLLASVLGLSIDGAGRRVRFDHPTLPRFLKQVTIRRLRVGSDTVDLALSRHPEDVGINVLGRSGAVEITTVK